MLKSKAGEEPEQTTGRNASFRRSQTASAGTMQLPASWGQSSRWLKGQRQPDQRRGHASVVLPKPPPALPALLSSLLQSAGQLTLEGRPTGSETFPCLVCHAPSLNISESRKPLQKQEVFADAVAGGWSRVAHGCPALCAFFVLPLRWYQLILKTEIQPINVESIKGQRNRNTGARSKTETAFGALGKYNQKERGHGTQAQLYSAAQESLDPKYMRTHVHNVTPVPAILE